MAFNFGSCTINRAGLVPLLPSKLKIPRMVVFSHTTDRKHEEVSCRELCISGFPQKTRNGLYIITQKYPDGPSSNGKAQRIAG